jgi:hypothetical protein
MERQSLTANCLEQTASSIAKLPSSEVQRARNDIAKEWRAKLAELLTEHPEVAPQLRDLLKDLLLLMPSLPQGWAQVNVAKAQASVYAVQAGKQIIIKQEDPEVPHRPTSNSMQ